LKRLVIVLAVVLAACGNDNPTLAPDAPIQPDAPVVNVTFTSFVIDLVKNQTADTTQPKPYSDFSTLPDPDSNNAAAYTSLFP
jgi:hypothetical protein